VRAAFRGSNQAFQPLNTPPRGCRFLTLTLVEKGHGESKVEPPADLFQRNIIPGLRAGSVQFGSGFGVDNFFVTQFREKIESCVHLTVRQRVNQLVKPFTVRSHASIVSQS
jgi:hypothetical protein